jgi:hypothetical protein
VSDLRRRAARIVARRPYSGPRRPRSLAALALALALVSSCKRERVSANLPRVASYQVTVDRVGGLGTPDTRVPLTTSDTFQVTAQALDRNGEPVTDHDGKAALRVTPGRLANTQQTLQFAAGVATAPVAVEGVFGKTVLWVEDRVGYDLGSGKAVDGTYATGIGGPIWYASPTIYDVQKITGPSDTNALPQSYLTVAEASLAAGQVMDLIVTALFPDGFYVTDLAPGAPADPDIPLPRAFRHMYVYSFNFPEDLVVGDRLHAVTGTVTEFSGATQLTFPSWRPKLRPNVSLAELRKDLPVPVDITRAICNQGGSDPNLCGSSKSNLHLEALESGRVKLGEVEAAKGAVLCDPESGIPWPSTQKFRSYLRAVPGVDVNLWTDARLAQVCPTQNGDPVQFPNCDINRDSQIPFPPFPNPPAQGHCAELATEVLRLECECKLACEADPLCAEQSVLRLFGQWSAALYNPGTSRYDLKVGLISNLAAPDWLPEEHPGVLVKVTGVLRQVRAARPPWLVVLDEAESFCCLPDPTDPAGQACPTEKRCP